MNFRLYKQIVAENVELQSFPFKSELKMEAFIIDNPTVLSSDEYTNIDVLTNQLHLPEGRKTSDGRIDIILDIDNEHLAIVELKKGTIELTHIEQLKEYLNEATTNRERFLRILNSNYDYSAHSIIGLIVGNDINNELKPLFEKGLSHNGVNIHAVTLSRYRTADKKEIYTLSEIFAPRKSAISKVRFKDWNEFADQLTKRGFTQQIISLAHRIHNESIKYLDLSVSSVVYAPNAYTLNTSLPKRRTVFAYIHIQKQTIKIYLSYKNSVPEEGLIHSNSDRYPDLFYISLSPNDDITSTIKEMIKKSLEIINSL